MLLLSYAMLSIALPDGTGLTIIYANIFVSFFAVFGLRGVYFALLEENDTPAFLTGAVTGMVSFVGYTPEIFFAPITGRILDASPGIVGHQNYFLFLAGVMIVGALVVFWLLRLQQSDDRDEVAARSRTQYAPQNEINAGKQRSDSKQGGLCMSQNNRFRDQLQRNSVALISLVIAITSLGYNTWRNEASEHNRNQRLLSIEVLRNIGELQQVVYHRHWDKDVADKGNPRTGWALVLSIRDLTQVLDGKVPESGATLWKIWDRHWQQLGGDAAGYDSIIGAMDGVLSKRLHCGRAPTNAYFWLAQHFCSRWRKPCINRSPCCWQWASSPVSPQMTPHRHPSLRPSRMLKPARPR